MWRIFFTSVGLAIIIVSLAHFFYYQGGEVLLRLGVAAALFIDVFILFMDKEDMVSYCVPDNLIMVLNVGIYSIIVFLFLVFVKPVRKSE
jgi:hypothetical protein